MNWPDPAVGTVAFAQFVDDSGAPGRHRVHWVVYDLPAATRAIAEDLPRTSELPGGGRQGRNSWVKLSWDGPSPLPGSAHRHFSRLYALSTPLESASAEILRKWRWKAG